MADLVSPLVECAMFVFGPIYRNAKNLFKLQSNLRSLDRKKRVLKEIEDALKQQLEAADRDGKELTPQVKDWLRRVGEVLVVADEIEPVSGCFQSCVVCRKVKRILEQVERLTDACPPERLVAIDRAPPSAEHIPAPSLEGQTNLDHVMQLLCHDQVGSIGIWGMGGVGKTTLAKNLNNKLHTDASFGQQFGMVIWATVSKDFNMKRVQSQIADRLRMDVGLSDDKDRMAVRIHERLMRENKFLLILDDVWEAIDLDRLGIPKPQQHNGVKIVLTSRSKRVCENMKTDEQVQVSVLNDEEAWELFSETVGRVANLDEIKPIAQQVCQQCCGLPLAVVIVGAAMRGKDMTPLWNDALNELQRSVPSIDNVEEQVFKPLKWSYDKLQGNDLKSCFLYCCLYPEDFSIEISELVKCWMGEGLIDEELNSEESLNRGLALTQSLKEACLLETGKRIGTEDDMVKMHDVVRDVAIWISTNYLEDGSKFLVRAGIGLTRLSQVKFRGNLKRISFMNNQIVRLPCDDACFIECSTLFLQGNPSLIEVPDGFLRRFQAITVLNLGDTNISSLPPFIMQLTNLGTLVLRGCQKLKELPASGWENLKRMQVFDLCNTKVKELPGGMGMLTKLKELDLSITRRHRSISAGVFSTLSSLEMLNMEGSWYVWGLKEEVEVGEAYLEELESLETLHGLYIQLKPNSSLSWVINPTWIERLTKFRLCIGAMPDIYNALKREKEIIMGGINPAEEERSEYLLSITSATSLLFHRCGGLGKLVQHMGLNTNACFSALKSLTISQATINLRALEHECGAKHDLLPNLEGLCLYHVGGIRSISELALHLGLTFSKLQWMYVRDCNEMKYLLWIGHHLTLQGLAEMRRFDCQGLEKVFEYVPHPHNDSVEVVPNLKKINLSNLPELRTLCSSNKAETWPSLEEIRVEACSKLSKLPISGQNNSIKKIKVEETWWNNLEWEDPNINTSLRHLFE